MSRIDDLIAEHCPGGVEYEPLLAVAEYSTARIDASELDATTFVGVDNLVADKGGKVDASYLPNTARLTAYKANDVLIGNIRPYLKKIWLATNSGGCSGDVLAVHITDQRVDAQFLFYLLSADGFFSYNMLHARGAKMPRGNKDAIMQFRIPLPPFEVQREIVRILDTFTELEAELEAELDARRQQYEYYREQLVVPGNLGADEWVPLSEIGTLFRGLTGKSKADFAAGNARYVTYVNVFSNIAVNPSLNDYVRVGPAERQRRLEKGDILFTGSSESADEVGMTSVVTHEPSEATYLNSFCIGLRQSAPSVLEPEYAKHLFRSSVMRQQIQKTANGVTRFNVSKSRLSRVRVPIPARAAQVKIAEELDAFEALVNDLSFGLPAELTARRQQFEHYRDRLLTFEEAPV